MGIEESFTTDDYLYMAGLLGGLLFFASLLFFMVSLITKFARPLVYFFRLFSLVLIFYYGIYLILLGIIGRIQKKEGQEVFGFFYH